MFNKEKNTAKNSLIFRKVSRVFLMSCTAVTLTSAMWGCSSGSEVKKVGEVTDEQQEESVDNTFNVGEIVETDALRISFLSASQYQEENEFLQPKDGYEYWKFEFKFENISDSDQSVSTMIDWVCYADNSNVDQAWIGDDNGLDTTLSSGRETQGAIYFEVPIGAENIELEYDINFWQSDKIIFVAK